MGLLSAIVGLPLLPVRGVISLAEILREQAERELYDPARIRRELEEAEMAAASGELSEEEKARAQQEALQPLVSRSRVVKTEGRPEEERK